MKRKIFLKESDLERIVLNILEQVQDESEYYKISPQEYKDKLEAAGYRGDILTRLKMFQGKPLWITGNLQIGGTPTTSLGNVGYIDGNLDISNTNIADISNTKVKGSVSDWHSKRHKLKIAAELRAKREEANERRKDGEWDLENTDDIGLKANALFEWLVGQGDLQPGTDEEREELKNLRERLSELQQDYDIGGTSFEMGPIYDEIKEIEEKIEEIESKETDVYDIVPTKYSNYGLTTFEVLSLPNREYTVGTEEEMDDAVRDYAKMFISDNGVQGFRGGYIENFIDEKELESYIYDFYYDDVSQNPDVYFDESDFELTEEQEERKEQLENYIYEMEDLKTELEEKQSKLELDSDEYDEIQEQIDEVDENIEKAQDEIDGIVPDDEPTDEMIEDKVNDFVKDRLRDPLDFINEFGLNLEDFIDEDDLIQSWIDDDGYGIMSSYDGNYDTINIDGEYYYIMRLN